MVARELGLIPNVIFCQKRPNQGRHARDKRSERHQQLWVQQERGYGATSSTPLFPICSYDAIGKCLFIRGGRAHEEIFTCISYLRAVSRNECE